MRRYGPAVAAILGLMVVTGCTAAAGDDPTSEDREILVLAAASLSEAFAELARDFEADSPGVRVRLVFAGSSDLISQLAEGAPGDVLATADEDTMAKAASEGLLASPAAVFATNTLSIAVPRGNPASIHGLDDLASPGIRLVICAPQVPCGHATRTLADTAGVPLRPVSEESSVTDVLAKVASGEADAGLVYVTDIARAGGRVEAVAFDGDGEVVNRYPIATTSASPSAARFVAYVLGSRGSRLLHAAGFGAP